MQGCVTVELGARTYEIRIGSGLLDCAGAWCAERVRGRSALVVSDANVAPLYLDRVLESLRAAGFRVASAVVPAGEGSKSPAELFRLYEAALEAGLDRRSPVVALGGGVVGDLAGFLAATWLRGVPFVQLPTTLLAMVDSAVGGKTGIDLPGGKNLVGAFHQPALVAADLDTLRTLPRRETVAGLAEVVKYGAIRDRALLDRIERETAGILAGASPAVAEVVERCCRIKAEIVGADEREAGARALLNFGHTLGHALETAAGYGTLLHGEAVSVGMVYAARLSVERTGLPVVEADRLEALLRALGLPVRHAGLAWADVRRAMSADKKTRGGVPRFVLLRRLGEAVAGEAVPEAALEEAWHVVGE